jgi:hypothetical protein
MPPAFYIILIEKAIAVNGISPAFYMKLSAKVVGVPKMAYHQPSPSY